MQLASTSTPRSDTNSATCSYDSGYRRYQRTHKMITSPGCWRPLKGLFGVIGMDFYPTSLYAPKVATEPVQHVLLGVEAAIKIRYGGFDDGAVPFLVPGGGLCTEGASGTS